MLKDRMCCVKGCNNHCVATINGYECCNLHYQRMRLYGNFNNRPKEKTNLYDFSNEDFVIIITKKGQKIYVDKEDFDKIKNWSWCVNAQGYAVANIKNKVVKMNWVLFPTIKGYVQDHINGNKLDNRKCNLRSCTQHENSMNCSTPKNNSSGYIGVVKVKSGNYVARIMFRRKQIHLGTFKTIEEAIKKRKEAEIKYFGEYVRNEDRK